MNETDKIIDVKIMEDYLFTLTLDEKSNTTFETLYILSDQGYHKPLVNY